MGERQTSNTIKGRIKKSNVPPITTKQCPYCAEIVNMEAIICRHCHKDISFVTSTFLTSLPPNWRLGPPQSR